MTDEEFEKLEKENYFYSFAGIPSSRELFNNYFLVEIEHEGGSCRLFNGKIKRISLQPKEKNNFRINITISEIIESDNKIKEINYKHVLKIHYKNGKRTCKIKFRNGKFYPLKLISLKKWKPIPRPSPEYWECLE